MNTIEYTKYFDDVAPMGSMIDSNMVSIMKETNIIDFIAVESLLNCVDNLRTECEVVADSLSGDDDFVVMEDRDTRRVCFRLIQKNGNPTGQLLKIFIGKGKKIDELYN